MGEENNLEKRLIFSGMVSASINPEPQLEWNHEDTEPIRIIKETFNTEQGFECSIEPHDMKAFRKLLGLPEVPTSKPKRHRKTFKKALMAYGIERNNAEIVCETIGQRCFWYPYSYYDCYTKIFTLLGK